MKKRVEKPGGDSGVGVKGAGVCISVEGYRVLTCAYPAEGVDMAVTSSQNEKGRERVLY